MLSAPDLTCPAHHLPASYLQGVVTHITDVKPLAAVVAYTDSEQGFEIYQVCARHGRVSLVHGLAMLTLSHTGVGRGQRVVHLSGPEC